MARLATHPAPGGDSFLKTLRRQAAANGDLLLSLTDEHPMVQRVRVSVVPKATRPE
jgi:hypothetical protein